MALDKRQFPRSHTRERELQNERKDTLKACGCKKRSQPQLSFIISRVDNLNDSGEKLFYDGYQISGFCMGQRFMRYGSVLSSLLVSPPGLRSRCFVARTKGTGSIYARVKRLSAKRCAGALNCHRFCLPAEMLVADNKRSE